MDVPAIKKMPHPLWFILALTIVLTLTGCETGQVRTTEDIEAAETEAATTTDDQLQQVRKLLEQAENSSTLSEQLNYRIQATRILINIGELDSAKTQLAYIAEQPADDPSLLADITILKTRIAIDERQLTDATSLASTIKPVTRQQQIEYYGLKADIDHLSGRFMNSVDRRSQLESYLDSDALRLKNHIKIWSSLTSMSADELNSQTSSKPVVNGWLDLARVTREHRYNLQQLESALLDWGTKHPQHPANDSFLATLLDSFQQESEQTGSIAVILPLSGELGTVANTVKNGILTAYYEDARLYRPELRFYDSGNEQFTTLYNQAISDGADVIVGPIDKSLVTYLAEQESLYRPVLALNYAESDTVNNRNLYQFGLSPEDEAEQMAELAISQGKIHAAVFYPDSDWGRRVRLAFNRHFVALGGIIQTEADYVSDSNDFKLPIRSLLNLDKSSIRQRRVENIIGERVQSESYRRQDVDMIFLAGTSRSARSIMPSFKFHHAGDLPVYATSLSYSGSVNTDLDRDLNGLYFCDLPWILQDTSVTKQAFEANWPEQQAYTRLFALGVDAYRLTSNLDYLSSFAQSSYPGLTGDISLKRNNQIRRKLLWARFISGKPVIFTPETFDLNPDS
jgi:outer membrane PBP1 activator LpoA protein